jgi:hypothetical protein
MNIASAYPSATYPGTAASYNGSKYVGSYNLPTPLSTAQAMAPQTLSTAPPTGTSSASSNAPQQNSSGQFINTATGVPYHGMYTAPNGQVSYYSNGKQVPSAADVGIQNQAFSVSSTAKNPVISGEASSLANEEGGTQPLLSKSFNDYLNEASTIGAQGASQLATDQAAYDPSATIARENNDVSNETSALNSNNQAYDTAANNVQSNVAANARDYTSGLNSNLNTLENSTATTGSNLNATNNQYATEQQGVQGNIAATNNQFATDTNSRLANLSSTLTAQNQAYETAAQAVAAQAYQASQKQNALYQLGTGTPTSGSGNMDNRYIRAYADINTPLQADLANRNYNQTMTLNSLGTTAANQIYGNTMSQDAGESALNSDLANRTNSIQQYLQGLYSQNYNAGQGVQSSEYGANQGVNSAASALDSDVANRNAATTQTTTNADTQAAQYIQSLKTATAGMSRAAAAQYLQQLAVPQETAAQILSAQTGDLSALSGLDSTANFITANTPFNSSAVPQANAYPIQRPARSYTPGQSNTATGGSIPVDASGTPLRSYTGGNQGYVSAFAPNGGTSGGTPVIGNLQTGPLQSVGNGMYQDASGGYWAVGADGNWTPTSPQGAMSGAGAALAGSLYGPLVGAAAGSYGNYDDDPASDADEN